MWLHEAGDCCHERSQVQISLWPQTRETGQFTSQLILAGPVLCRRPAFHRLPRLGQHAVYPASSSRLSRGEAPMDWADLAIESKIPLRSLTSDLWNYSLRPQPTQLRRIDFLIVNLSLLFMPAFSAARILRRSTK